MKIHRGLTVLELMLALSVFLIILASMHLKYLAEQRYLKSQLTFSQAQDNARIALQLLTQAIQTAGYMGCQHFITSVHGSDTELTLKQAGKKYAILVENMQDLSHIKINQEIKLKPRDWLIIEDCQTVDVVEIKQVLMLSNNQQIIITRPLTKKYVRLTKVRLLEINTYFIGKTSRKNSALYFKNIHQINAELVENIEHMELRYMDVTGQELAAKEVMDWSKIIGISLCLDIAKKPWYLFVALRNRELVL